MNDLSPRTTTTDAPAQIIARLSAPRIFSMERQEDFDSLRSGHLAELSPKTAYESTLAEDLVRYQWEIVRMLRFRDSVLLECYREKLFNVLVNGDVRLFTPVSDVSDDKFDLVHDLVSRDVATREIAEKEFYEITGLRAEDILATAYASSMEVRTFNDRVVDLERRRRSLREDYARLAAFNAHLEVEDAELAEARDGD